MIVDIFLKRIAIQANTIYVAYVRMIIYLYSYSRMKVIEIKGRSVRGLREVLLCWRPIWKMLLITSYGSECVDVLADLKLHSRHKAEDLWCIWQFTREFGTVFGWYSNISGEKVIYVYISRRKLSFEAIFHLACDALVVYHTCGYIDVCTCGVFLHL